MNGTQGVAGRHGGPHLGVVVSNLDPEQRGRLMVRVPDVLGEMCTVWAESASPLAGPQMGMFVVPPINTGVFVEFLDDDLEAAVWTGCWRGSSADVPAEALAAPPVTPPIVVQSQAQNRIVISSVPGQGIRLETAAGQLGPYIDITATGVTIAAGTAKVEVTVAGLVRINGSALTVQ